MVLELFQFSFHEFNPPSPARVTLEMIHVTIYTLQCLALVVLFQDGQVFLPFLLFSTRLLTPSLGCASTPTRSRTLAILAHLALRRVPSPALILRHILADIVVCGRGFERVGLHGNKITNQQNVHQLEMRTVCLEEKENSRRRHSPLQRWLALLRGALRRGRRLLFRSRRRRRRSRI